MKLNGSDYLPLRAGLKTPELVEIARILERDGLDAVEVSVGHYESGFPVVRGTFGRCLRNMVQGSVRFLAEVRRVLFTVFWPLLALGCNLIWRPREGTISATRATSKRPCPFQSCASGGSSPAPR